MRWEGRLEGTGRGVKKASGTDARRISSHRSPILYIRKGGLWERIRGGRQNGGNGVSFWGSGPAKSGRGQVVSARNARNGRGLDQIRSGRLKSESEVVRLAGAYLGLAALSCRRRTL